MDVPPPDTKFIYLLYYASYKRVARVGDIMYYPNEHYNMLAYSFLDSDTSGGADILCKSSRHKEISFNAQAFINRSSEQHIDVVARISYPDGKYVQYALKYDSKDGRVMNDTERDFFKDPKRFLPPTPITSHDVVKFFSALPKEFFKEHRNFKYVWSII